MLVIIVHKIVINVMLSCHTIMLTMYEMYAFLSRHVGNACFHALVQNQTCLANVIFIQSTDCAV